MEEVEGMKVIAFAANKGGVGKTRHVILAGNCLGAAGYRVGIIGMDFNNSAEVFH